MVRRLRVKEARDYLLPRLNHYYQMNFGQNEFFLQDLERFVYRLELDVDAAARVIKRIEGRLPVKGILPSERAIYDEFNKLIETELELLKRAGKRVADVQRTIK